jgi:restriction system protein
MAIPDYQSLMLPVLRLASQGEKRVVAIVDEIANELGLSEEERTQLLPSGRQGILHNRIHWAKFYMSKAGLIEPTGRGRFIATEAGKSLLARNPSRIDVTTLLAYPEFKDFYSNGKPSIEPRFKDTIAVVVNQTNSPATPEEIIDSAFQALETALRSDILERISLNSPSFFESLIIDVLVAMGYGGSHKDAASQLGRSGDGGVDGVINEDRLGLDRIYVQAKRYAAGSSVGRPEIQAFVGSLVGLGATKGVFVTTASFSPQAREFVKHLTQRIVLLDGNALAELMIEHRVGVRTSRLVDLKRVDEDFFAPSE